MAKSNVTPARSLPIDDPVSIALGKARSMAAVMEQLGEGDGMNNLVQALNDGSFPDETLVWLHSVVGEALRSALDDIERAYGKVLASEEVA